MDARLAKPAPVQFEGEAAATQAAFARLLKEKAELQVVNERLTRELSKTQSRLGFVEDLLGPTETQRKVFQVQLTSARDAALKVAHACSGSVPTRCVGRLDERWLRVRGLSDQECSMLQRGCVSGEDGVPFDISMLGDPMFKPYDEKTLTPLWDARGGYLQLSLGDIRERWGEEVAMEVLRCAMELDRHDASRRLGVELPWNEKENREMEPGEVIALLGEELQSIRSATTGASIGSDQDEEESSNDSDWDGLPRSGEESPLNLDEGGTSRAWSMLEAMMNDLGLNQRMIGTPSPAPDQVTIDEDTDEEVVAEALEQFEEEDRAELQLQTLQEQDIQQMLQERPFSCPPTTSRTWQALQTQQECSRARTDQSSETRLSTSTSNNPRESRQPSTGPRLAAAQAREPSTDEAFLKLLEDEEEALSPSPSSSSSS